MEDSRLSKESILIDVDDIKPYSNNNKVHTEQGVSELIANYKTVGIIDPVYVDENNIILAGHKRWLAARELGLEKVECVKVSGLNNKQKKIYRLASNKLTHNSSWDFINIEKELQEFEKSLIVDLGIDFDLSLPDFSPTSEDDQGKLDEKELKDVTCPHCGYEFKN